MNAERRKQIEQAANALEQAKATLEQVLEDEQEAFDNLPESFQDGERGEAMNEAIELLEGVVSALDDPIDEARQAAE